MTSPGKPGDPAAAVLRVGVLGAGVVGSQVIRLLLEQADDLAARVGARVELAAVAVRRPHRHAEVPAGLLTDDAAAVVADPSIDVIVEVMGGIDPTRELLLTALRRGASVVTANKALLAEDGPTLYAAADAAGADLYFEAAVAGAIPLIRPLRESLAGDRISQVLGIVNGTTNFILSAMTATGDSYELALKEAGRLGYAEADPTADVDGFDAAAKAAILASVAFHTRVGAADVHREGIGAVSAADVAAATEIGCVIKLLAICERNGGAAPGGAADGGAAAGDDVVADETESVSARVHPVMLPNTHPLARVDGAFNAVYVQAESAGQLMFYGPGAGGAPTASAVLGDLVAVARNRVAGGRGPRESAYADLPLRPFGEVPTRYYVSLDVLDRAGVLSAVASTFADGGVSIATVRQQGRGDDASLVLVTHAAPEAALAATVDKVAALDVVRSVASVMRVMGEVQ
ncbi:homoserine dehydrogenase [Nakamurella aerolata]|uniref:Homoserine dehydrogenase n=1 Tax=Nakamurella aerolata TaxID=1656892 RepID=A0A849AE54_9ACTN|nr:homoserine dehydrogenase [Nakamurella aerolata]NNG37468.1 homoserine dehydrogenase [Nakamurella aerolata]